MKHHLFLFLALIFVIMLYKIRGSKVLKFINGTYDVRKKR